MYKTLSFSLLMPPTATFSQQPNTGYSPGSMSQPCYLKIHVNGQETFFLNEKIVATYSRTIKKMIKQEKRTQIKKPAFELNGFPGGPEGFELVSRFCHNNGGIKITLSNVCLLHCCAVFLDMTEEVSPCNLLQQTDEFLEGMFYWSLSDIIVTFKSCEPFFEFADSETGLVQRLLCALLAKISQNSDMSFVSNSTSSSSSSPETASGFRLSSQNTPLSVKFKPGSSSQAWWFSELTVLPPIIIEKVIKTMGGCDYENSNSLVLTKFLLHYLKTASHKKGLVRCGYGVLADIAVKGVIFMGKTSFSCRGLFWVLRVLSGLGLSKDSRTGLERLIGDVLDQATLDDLLVSGYDRGVYDVNLVLRLIRLFVHSDGVSAQRMKKVGRLVDKYMGEIAPDQTLKLSKFIAVAESLPDPARGCFDGLYRAIDIYLESHPNLSSDERSRLCTCLNYKKLTLEACKDIAKNPRTPPRVAVQALMSQQSSSHSEEGVSVSEYESPKSNEPQVVLYKGVESGTFSDENEDMRLNLEKMQWRVKELEKVCRDMKGQMSKMAKHSIMASSSPTRALPRLC